MPVCFDIFHVLALWVVFFGVRVCVFLCVFSYCLRACVRFVVCATTTRAYFSTRSFIDAFWRTPENARHARDDARFPPTPLAPFSGGNSGGEEEAQAEHPVPGHDEGGRVRREGRARERHEAV